MGKLLSRIMPFEKLISLAARFGFLAKPLGIAADAWLKAQGYRSQLCIAAAALLASAAAFGFIPWEMADPVIAFLLGKASAALLDKWNRMAPTLRDVSAKVADKAQEAPKE